MIWPDEQQWMTAWKSREESVSETWSDAKRLSERRKEEKPLDLPS